MKTFALALVLAACCAPLLAAPPAVPSHPVPAAVALPAAPPASLSAALSGWNAAILPAAAAPAVQSLELLLAPPSFISCPPRCSSLNCNFAGGCSCLQVGFCIRCEC